MTIDWLAFVTVFAARCSARAGSSSSSRSRCGSAMARPPWRRPVSVALYALCAAIVMFGIWLIVPFFR